MHNVHSVMKILISKMVNVLQIASMEITKIRRLEFVKLAVIIVQAVTAQEIFNANFAAQIIFSMNTLAIKYALLNSLRIIPKVYAISVIFLVLLVTDLIKQIVPLAGLLKNFIVVPAIMNAPYSPFR
jgi:hypothetical protein